VRDAAGQPLAGVAVSFVVTQGGGAVQVSSVVTNAQGSASAGRWTLGTTAGANEVNARVGSLAPVRFTATGTTPLPPTGAYDIVVRYLATATPRQQQAVASAVNRWRTVITGDLANIPVTAPAASCFSTQPALNETVDDLLIFVEFVAIDGPGKTLGEAGPCYIRSDNSLPIVGHLKLDAADLAQMESYGTLDDVVLHEIGHVLGIGTLWPSKGLILGAGTADPLFAGSYGNGAYQTMGGGGTYAPIENTGEVGTRDGHWRESTFGNELMTGWVSAGGNPISGLTVGSLRDLGYGANPGAASGYTLGATSGPALVGLDLGRQEKTVRPKWKIDRLGKRSELPK
jgi:hypothetical protein